MTRTGPAPASDVLRRGLPVPALGAAAVVLGVAMVVLALLPWYAASLPDGSRDRVSGVGATGELWTLLALGALVVVMGLALVLGRPAPGSSGTRRAGALIALAGALGVVWAARNALDVPVRVVAEREGAAGAATLPADAVAIDVLPAAWMGVAVCALVAVCGLLALWDRPG